MLALKNKHIDGIKLDLYLTKDNILIAIDDINLTRLGINQKYVNDHSFKHLRKLNLGTKVKKNFILSLNEITNFIPQKKVIIANIFPSNDKLQIMIQKIIQVTKNNPNINWLITSNYKKILDELLLIDNKNFKTGKIVVEEYDWNFSFEFYIVNKNNLNTKYILEKLNNNQTIFINNVDNKKEFNYIQKEFKNINIISTHSNKLLY